MPDFPVGLSETEQWTCIPNQISTTSELNRTIQVETLPGDQWKATITLVDLEPSEIRQLRALLMALRGQSNSFSISPADSNDYDSSPSGSPFVSGANQTGSSLNTSGWPGNTLVRQAGDYFEVNGELKCLIQDCTSNASGDATLVFEPPLRQNPPNAEPVIYDRPACQMRLANPEQAGWQISTPLIGAISLELVEAL